MTVERFVVTVTMAATLLLADASAGRAESRCGARKLTASAREIACLFGLEAKEAKSGDLKDTGKVEACNDKLAGAFAKAEKPDDCVVKGDAPDVEASIAAFVAQWDVAISGPVQPPPSRSKCTIAKLKATGTKAKC